MRPMHRSSGGNGVGNNRIRGFTFSVEVGQRRQNGGHWNLRYTKKPNENIVSVRAGQRRPNGDHWLLDFTHGTLQGHSLEVEGGQQKQNGDHWNVKYTNNRDEHSINVRAGQKKPNGDHWLVDFNHDILNTFFSRKEVTGDSQNVMADIFARQNKVDWFTSLVPGLLKKSQEKPNGGRFFKEILESLNLKKEKPGVSISDVFLFLREYKADNGKTRFPTFF